MKKVHTLLKILMVVSVLIFCNACSSGDDGTTTPTLTTVTAESLNGYYIPHQEELQDGTQRFRVVYFVNEEGTMKAYLDGPGTRRVVPLIVNDNKFVYDLNADGSYVINFSFSIDNTGKISLTNLTRSGFNSTLIHYEMFSGAQTPSWGGFTFERTSGVASFYKYYSFSGDKTLYANSVDANSEPNLGCYQLGNGVAFKSNNDNLMGIFVPSWKGDTNVKMLLMNINIPTIALFKHYN